MGRRAQSATQGTRAEIARLCRAGLDARSLRTRVLARLRVAVPFDALWWASADPATFLFTNTAAEEIPASAAPLFLRNELLGNDVNSFASLARRAIDAGAAPTVTLFDATKGVPERSKRFREILTDLHMGDELRVAFIADGQCWGFACIHREGKRTPFSKAEVDFVSGIAPRIAEGLRSAVALRSIGTTSRQEQLSSHHGESDDSPGLVLLTDHLEIEAVTPSAERWVSELANDSAAGTPPPIAAVATQLLAIERASSAPRSTQRESVDLRAPRVRVQTLSGSWIVLHALRLAKQTAGMAPRSDVHVQERSIAVVIERAHPAEVAPLQLAAAELTSRETEVVRHVLRGEVTKAIANKLAISPLTVQQHLKSIFAKLDVTSRNELTALFQSQLPR